MDAGGDLTRALLRDLPAAEVAALADAVPRLQDDRDGVAAVRRAQLAHPLCFYAAVYAREW